MRKFSSFLLARQSFLHPKSQLLRSFTILVCFPLSFFRFFFLPPIPSSNNLKTIGRCRLFPHWIKRRRRLLRTNRAPRSDSQAFAEYDGASISASCRALLLPSLIYGGSLQIPGGGWTVFSSTFCVFWRNCPKNAFSSRFIENGRNIFVQLIIDWLSADAIFSIKKNFFSYLMYLQLKETHILYHHLQGDILSVLKRKFIFYFLKIIRIFFSLKILRQLT